MIATRSQLASPVHTTTHEETGDGDKRNPCLSSPLMTANSVLSAEMTTEESVEGGRERN